VIRREQQGGYAYRTYLSETIWIAIVVVRYRDGVKQNQGESQLNEILPASVKRGFQRRMTRTKFEQVFDANSLYWPTGESFKLEKDFEGVTDKGYYYSGGVG
jgi:hypothetical protein